VPSRFMHEPIVDRALWDAVRQRRILWDRRAAYAEQNRVI